VLLTLAALFLAASAAILFLVRDAIFAIMAALVGAAFLLAARLARRAPA